MLTKRWILFSVAVVVAFLPAAGADEWKSLFNGKKLGKWEVVDKFDFINHGKVEVKDGRLVLGKGDPGTGIRFTGEFPKVDYELELEAMRVEGEDFFCGLTFHVGKAPLSLIVGGWRGPVVGLSLIDGEPAVDLLACDLTRERDAAPVPQLDRVIAAAVRAR